MCICRMYSWKNDLYISHLNIGNGEVPGDEGDSVKNKFFTRKFVPAAHSLQVLGRDGYYNNEKVIGLYQRL